MDLRVNDIDPDLIYALKVIALGEQRTLRQLVIDVLTNYRNQQPRAAKLARPRAKGDRQ